MLLSGKCFDILDEDIQKRSSSSCFGEHFLPTFFKPSSSYFTSKLYRIGIFMKPTLLEEYPRGLTHFSPVLHLI